MALRRNGLLDLIRRALPAHTHSHSIEVRITAVEEQLFKMAAEDARTTVSEWLRAAGRGAARVQLTQKRGAKRKGRPARRRARKRR